MQHALRAFTPRDQKAVRAAAETFRPNPRLDTARAISERGVGEALVSTLQESGVPSMVERGTIRPPRSRIGPLTPSERTALAAGSALDRAYRESVDRDSAYEILAGRLTVPEARAQPGAETAAARRSAGARASGRQTLAEAALKSALRSASSSIGREIGRQLLRGLLGSLRRG